MDKVREFLTHAIKDIFDYDGSNRNINGTYTEEVVQFQTDDLSLDFMLALYVSAKMINISSDIIIDMKTQLRVSEEDGDYFDIHKDSLTIHKYMFDLNRDACFRVVLSNSEKLLDMILEKDISVIDNYCNVLSVVFIESIIKPGINASNRSTESIFSIITQAILDSHRRSSAKGGSSILSVANVVQGVTPKDEAFGFTHESVKTEKDAVNFLTTKIYGINFSDIIIEYRNYKPEEIKEIDIYGIYQITGFDSIVITINSIKQAMYEISLNNIIDSLNKIFSKAYSTVKNISTFYNDPDVLIPHIRIIIMLEFKSIKYKILRKIYGILGGVDIEKNIEKDLNKSVKSVEITKFLNVGDVDMVDMKLAKDQTNLKYISNMITSKESTVESLVKDYNGSNNTTNTYMLLYMMQVVYDTTISGVKGSELCEYKNNKFIDEIKEINIIKDDEYLVTIDNIEFKIHGFFSDYEQRIYSYTDNNIHLIKVDCVRFIIQEIELYYSKLSELLNIIKQFTLFPDNIKLYSNSILFYPYIESKYVSRFRQTMINMNIITGEITEIIYFEQRFLIKLNKNFSDIINDKNIITNIINNLGIDTTTLLDTMTVVKFRQNEKLNISMDYSKYVIIKEYINYLNNNRYITNQIIESMPNDPQNMMNRSEFESLLNDISTDIYNNFYDKDYNIIIDIIYNNIYNILDISKNTEINLNIIDYFYSELVETFDIDEVLRNRSNDYLRIMLNSLPKSVYTLYSINETLSINYTKHYITKLYNIILDLVDIEIKDIYNVLYDTNIKNVFNDLRDKLIINNTKVESKYITFEDIHKYINKSISEESLEFENNITKLSIRDKTIYEINEHIITYILNNFHVDLTIENIKRLIKSYDISVYTMSAYNGSITDYINVLGNTRSLSYQNVEDISLRYGIIAADQAYYNNIVKFLINSGMDISALHIELRSALMTFTGKYTKVSPASIINEPNAIYASRRDPKTVFSSRCLKPIHKVPSDDIIFGSAPRFGAALKYQVRCKDANCDELEYVDYMDEDECTSCEGGKSNMSYTSDRMSVEIHTISNSPRYINYYDERLEDPAAYTHTSEFGNTVDEDPETEDFLDSNPFEEADSDIESNVEQKESFSNFFNLSDFV